MAFSTPKQVLTGRRTASRLFFSIVGTIWVLLSYANVGRAQGTTGSIDVTVGDNSGAVAPGASVTAVNTGTGADFHEKANENGHCQFPLLPPGTYQIEAEHAGFQKLIRKGVIVDATSSIHLDLRLAIGAVNQTITVESSTPLIQSENATTGQVIDQRQITSTPLASRNFTQLLGTSAGVVGSIVNADNPGTGGSNVSVNGARNGSNSLLIDGASGDNQLNMAPDGDGTPSIEFLGEFRILSHDYGAEFGKNLGSVIDVTTRSGTNSFHGEAYDFLRNTDLNARPFFAPRRGQNVQNQFGANVGGPIRRNKTFFFVGWESSRQRNANSGSSTVAAVVPTVNERGGNFGAETILDPTTGLPFANNTIPTNRLSQTALSIQNQIIPQPNYGSAGATNFYAQQSVPTNIDQYTIRIDHHLSDRDQLWGRWFSSAEQDLSPFGGGLPGFGIFVNRKKKDATINYTHVFSPALVLESSVALNQTDQFETFTNKTSLQSVGLNPLPSTLQTGGLPQFGISNYLASGNVFGNVQGWADHVKTMTGRAGFTYTKARHTLKFGAEVTPDLFDDANQLNDRGVFNFTGAATGDAYADFLLGYTRSKLFGAGPGEIMTRDWLVGLYVSDQWKVTDHLTVNAGLRYEPFWQPAAYNFNMTNWWPDKYTGIGSLAASGIVQGGVNGVPLSTVYNNMHNLAPRLGIAYRIGDKWVIRSGAGQYFDQRTGQIAQQAFQNPPGYTNVSIDCTVAGSGCNLKTPDNFTFVNPGYNGSTIPFPTSPTQALSYSSIERNTKTDNAWQWDFTVQRQLPGDTLIEAAYVGTKGTHLMGNYVGNPLIPAGFNPKNPQPGALTPEFPGFGPNPITGQGASSSYNAFQLTVKKRIRTGVLQVAYTKSKTLSNGQDSSTRFYTSMGLAPWYDWSRAKGPADFDRPERLSIMFTQDLPNHFQSGIGKHLLNGWSANGLFITQSGTPLSVTNQTSGQGLGGADQGYSTALYSNVVAGAVLVTPGATDKKLNNYINAAAWSKAPFGTVGDSGRGMFRGPGQNNLDFSVAKHIPIRERVNMEFRSEFFNLLNHPNFGNPVISMDSRSFGQISTTTVNARLVQFALKMLF